MTSTNFNLQSKTVLITGGAGFLGSHFAASLLQNDCTVVISDLCSDSLAFAKDKLKHLFPDGRLHTVVLDVTSQSSIIEASQKLDSLSLNVDTLINNAAINPKVDGDGLLSNPSRLENFELDSWNQEINVGLTGAFLCTKVFGEKMAQNGFGNIINIASDLAVIAPNQSIYATPGISEQDQNKKPVTYSVIKHGLVGLTKYTATYWADKNVRCNSLSPGGVFNSQDPLFVERLTSLIPLQRMCELRDLEGAIQFLCSDASSYMNGHNLVLDGGRSIW